MTPPLLAKTLPRKLAGRTGWRQKLAWTSTMRTTARPAQGGNAAGADGGRSKADSSLTHASAIASAIGRGNVAKPDSSVTQA